MPTKSLRLLLALIAFANSQCVVPAQGVKDFASTKFYQILTSQDIIIKGAEFQRVNFSTDIPEAARSQFFSLTKNGSDYVLLVMAGTNNGGVRMAAGLFRGSAWGIVNGDLTFSDPKINNQQTPISGQEIISKMSANQLLSLGFYEFAQGSGMWDEQFRKLIGKSTSGEDLIITFEFKDGLPHRGILSDAVGGRGRAFVDYQYSPQIDGGTFPCSFVRHIGSPTNDLGKAFAINVLKLQWDNELLNQDFLDPSKLFKPKSVGFYSNGVTYTIDPIKGVQKVMTMEEYQDFLKKNSPTSVESNSRARIIIVFLMSVVTLSFIFFGVSKLKNKTKNEN